MELHESFVMKTFFVLLVVLLTSIYVCPGQGLLHSQASAVTNKHDGHSGYNSIPVPLISVSLTQSHRGYLFRLMKSIDHHVSYLIVTAGNINTTTMQQIRDEYNAGASYLVARFPQIKTVLNETQYNPGSVAGFNVAMRAMLSSISEQTLKMNIVADKVAEKRDAKKKTIYSHEWALVVNADVAFYPGVLKTIVKSVNGLVAINKVATSAPFGIGFTSLCCGAEWSAVVFTAKMVHAVGLMDENFYPAYYEDVDYGIRISLSGFKAHRIPSTPLLHGALDGSRDYLSGLFEQLYLRPNVADADLSYRRDVQYRGALHGHFYIEKKWNVSVGSFEIDGSYKPPSKSHMAGRGELDCKSVDGINGNGACNPGHKTPFGLTNMSDEKVTIASWQLDKKARQEILGKGVVP